MPMMNFANLLPGASPDHAPAMEPMLRACAAIATAPDLDTALGSACATAVDLLGFGHAAAILLWPDGTRGIVHAEHPRTWPQGTEIPLHDVPVLQGMVRSRTLLRSEDVRADSAMDTLQPLLQAAGVHALLAVPILRGERLLGWLSLHDTAHARAFEDAEVGRCQVLAQHLGVVVENARLKEQARAHAGELQTLRRASIAIGSLLQLDESDLETLLSRVVAHAVTVLQAKSGGIYRYEPMRKELTLVADYLRPHHRGKVLLPGEGLAGRLVQSRQQYATEPNYREWDGRAAVFEGEESFGSVLEVLLRWQGEITGVLYVDDDAGRRFSADDAARLGILADQAGVVLATAELRARESNSGGLLHALHRILLQSGATPLEDRLGLIAREAATVMNAESCQVLLAHTPDFLTLEAGYGHREGMFDKGRRFRIESRPGSGLTGHIAHEREVFRKHGAALRNHPTTRGLPNDHMPSGECCSLLAIPLLRRGDQDELLGLLRIENRRGPDGAQSPDIGFNESDEETARLFATAMENEVLLVALERRALMERRRDELMKRVFESRQQLRAEMDTRLLRHELTQVTAELLGYEVACLYDVDEGSEEMVVTAATGLPPGVRGDREPLDEGVAGLVALTEEPQVWVASERGKPYEAGGREFGLAIAAPLRRAGGEVASVLVIAGSSARRRFVEIDREVLGLFADQVSTLLQSSILWNWERRSFVRSSALGRIEEFIRRSRDRHKALSALLTGITAGYGLGFNRAAVFLLSEDRSTLRGEMAIGHLTESEARTDWMALEADGVENVRSSLESLEAHGHAETPLDRRVRVVRVPCPPELMLLLQAVQEYGGEIISEAEGLAPFPRVVLEAYPPVLPLVLVPLVLSGDVLGFVMADTPFGREKPASFDDLKRTVRLVATASAAIDDTPQRWALFNPEQMGALERLDERARPRPDPDWNALMDVQEQIVTAAVDIFHAASAVLWTYEARTESFRLVACAGLERGMDTLVRRHPPQQGGTSYKVLESGWLAVDEVDSERYDFLSASTLEVLAAVGARSFQGVALTVGDEQVGVLYIDYAQPRTFDADDAHMAVRFAERAALTLRRAQMQDVVHQVNRVRRTAQVLARVSTAAPLEEVLRTVVQGTRVALDSDAVTLYRYDSRTGMLLDPPTADGVWDEASLDAEDEKVVDHFVQRVLGGEPMRWVEDVAADPDFRETRFTREEKIRSCVAVSLRVRGGEAGEHQVGVMFVNFRTPHSFTLEERDNIRLFADQAAVAIHNAHLHEELNHAVEQLLAALQRVRASTALATFGIVDRQWRHNVAGFAPTIQIWVKGWKAALERGRQNGRIHADTAAELSDSIDKFFTATLREMAQRPVMVQPDEQLEPVLINELVNEAIGRWQKREGLIDLNLSARLEAGPSDAVYVNRHWIHAAIGTLIDNAAKSVTDTPQRDVILGTRRVDGMVAIEFTDTGCGIPPEQLAEFGTHPRSSRPDGEGIGIGLIIAQSIAFTYDGEVQAFRREGEPGSTVQISLPVFVPAVNGRAQEVAR